MYYVHAVDIYKCEVADQRILCVKKLKIYKVLLKGRT